MDRSVLDKALDVLTLTDRKHPITRAQLQEQLFDLCGVTIHERDLQDVVLLLISEGHRVISWTTGYWYFRGTAEDIEAAERAANTLSAHADSEYAKADQMRKWCAEAKREHERQAWRTAQQAGLFA